MAVPDATKPRALDAYEIGDRLGRGAASEVYAARHPVHGPQLAIKLIHGSLESTSARPVLHPNVVRVVEVGPDFVAMERIDGEDLAARLARGALSEPTVRTLFAAIADGMTAVHDAGIVHRDLKPANIMLRLGPGGEQPVIVDFGIAKSLGDQNAAATSRRIGTPAYMAPEQMTAGLITPALDVWALGVMLFEARTGTLPFAGFAEGRAPQLFEVAPRASTRADLSFALDALIARCLDREIARRPRSMRDIARELRAEPADDSERVTQDAGVVVSAPRMDPPTPRARRRIVAAVALAAIASAILAAFVVGRDGTQRVPRAAMPAASPVPSTVAVRAPARAHGPMPKPTPVAAPAPVVTPAPATPIVMMLTSVPTGAHIVIEGKLRGQTPAHLELASPTSIVLRRAGYRERRVRATQSGELSVRLVPAPKQPREETLD